MAIANELALIIERKNPELGRQIRAVAKIEDLQFDIRAQVADLLAQELAASGFNSEGEPTAYGLKLESMIDSCKLVSSRD